MKKVEMHNLKKTPETKKSNRKATTLNLSAELDLKSYMYFLGENFQKLFVIINLTKILRQLNFNRTPTSYCFWHP